MNTAAAPQSANKGIRTPRPRVRPTSSSSLELAPLHAPIPQTLLQLLGTADQSDHQQEHACRNCSAERPVIRCSEQADHDVRNPYSARAPHEQRREKIAKT